MRGKVQPRQLASNCTCSLLKGKLKKEWGYFMGTSFEDLDKESMDSMEILEGVEEPQNA